jgi:hypothetical protein
METITGAQKRCIKTMVGKLVIKDEDAMVMGFTGLRTGSVSEMTVTEGAAMIRHLKSLDPLEAKADVMRKKLIGMAYTRAGLSARASAKEKRAVIDWLNGWCQQYGYKHKALNSYTYNELPKLVTQFESVLESVLINI